MKPKEMWNSQATRFDPTSDSISPDVADNLLIAWPALLGEVSKHLADARNARVLDFGCGTGGLALRLAEMGFSVDGVDTSEGMIAAARKMEGASKVRFINSEISDLTDTYHAIVSCMVFQFIPNLADVAKQMLPILREKSILTFTTFNPDYVLSNTGPGRSFIALDGTVYFCLDNERIPVYARSADEFNQILGKVGFSPRSNRLLDFTDEFTNKYWDPSSGVDISHPEYLFMTFQKE